MTCGCPRVDRLLFASRSHALSTAEATIDRRAVSQRFGPPASFAGRLFLRCQPSAYSSAARESNSNTTTASSPTTQASCPGSITFEATGKIAAEDYRDVVLPALKQAAHTGKVRFLIVMREFDVSPEALSGKP